MCGLVGVSLRSAATEKLAGTLGEMAKRLSHRGPDHQGIWWSPDWRTGLGHRRLAILDLSPLGHQPMRSSDGRFTIAFNGEIFNFQALRRELEGKGASFHTRTDTEVIIELYRRHGEATPGLLRGMFAFAIHDAEDDSLFLARDSLGKKPLVYSVTTDGFHFASEIPALLGFPGISRRLDHSAIAGMLLHNFRHISDPHTAYENIKRLRPGSAMLVRNGQVEKCWRYWTPEASEPDSSPQRLRALLESAVERRMVADVPVGALLSGGVDSSAIVQLMSRLSRSPIPTFAFGFDRDDEDIRRARAMAKEIGTEHHEFFFDGKHQLDLFGHILRTHGEPIMLLPLIHTVELCRAIRDSGIKVVMTGHGADELFYGYTGHLRTARLSTLLSRAGLLRRLGPILSGRTGVKAIDLLVAAPGQRKATYYRAVARGLWGESLHPEMTKRIGNYPAEELSYWGELTPSGEYIDESNFVALMVENTHSVITAGDLPAMMASVEMRSPFLDEEIVRFALSCPWRAKLPNLKDTKLLKHILKAAVSDLVPEELLFAPKRGFGMGIQEDMVLRGPWREQGNELFAHPLDADGLFDPGKLRGLWRRFLANERGVPASYMAKLLSIQLWLRQAIH